MDRFQAIASFVKVVEAGSFAGAAARLDVSVSAVSRQVAELESLLGTRLLNRTTRRLSLTEAGHTFHERSVQLLADLDEAEEAVSSSSVVPRGTLRITTSVAFGVRHLARAIAEFSQRHGELRFDVQLYDRTVDLVDAGIDLAVRIGDVRSQALIARRIGATRLLCCASPDYIARHGAPRTPSELAAHPCLTYEYAGEPNIWRFTDRLGTEHAVRVAGPGRTNSGEMLAAMAAAGMGIVFEPDFIVGPEIRAGRLARILGGYTPASADIHAVYPSRRHLSAKVRAFVDFLVARYAQNPEWAFDPETTPERPARRLPAKRARRAAAR